MKNKNGVYLQKGIKGGSAWKFIDNFIEPLFLHTQMFCFGVSVYFVYEIRQ